MYARTIPLLLLLFALAACQGEPSRTASVQATPSPAASEAPAAGGAVAAPAVLTADQLNSVPLEDVIQEVGFFGGAGGSGEICFDQPYETPTFWYLEDRPTELMQIFKIDICGLPVDDNVRLTVQRPDGEETVETLPVINLGGGAAAASYEHLPLWNDPSGIYRFAFEGTGWKLETSREIVEPGSPRLYSYRSSLYLLGFAAHEPVRLLVYLPAAGNGFAADNFRLGGWAQYQVDGQGKLEIALKIEGGTYVALGETSGAANVTDAESRNRSDWYAVYCSGAPQPLGLTLGSYAEVLVDRLPIYRLDDSSGAWRKTNEEIAVEKGSLTQIESNASCGEGVYLWSITCPEQVCNYRVPESGPEGAYFRPIESTAAVSTLAAAQAVACAGAQPTRLRVGMDAEVTTSGKAPQLALRDGPGLSSSKVHVIAAGRDMEILKGPVCDGGAYWWYVVSEQGFEGWASEGDGQDYWIDPLP